MFFLKKSELANVFFFLRSSCWSTTTFFSLCKLSSKLQTKDITLGRFQVQFRQDKNDDHLAYEVIHLFKNIYLKNQESWTEFIANIAFWDLYLASKNGRRKSTNFSALIVSMVSRKHEILCNFEPTLRFLSIFDESSCLVEVLTQSWWNCRHQFFLVDDKISCNDSWTYWMNSSLSVKIFFSTKHLKVLFTFSTGLISMWLVVHCKLGKEVSPELS